MTVQREGAPVARPPAVPVAGALIFPQRLPRVFFLL